MTLPRKLMDKVDSMEEQAAGKMSAGISGGAAVDDESYKVFLGNCKKCQREANKFIDQVAAGGDTFRITGEDIDECLGLEEVLKESIASMQQAPIAAIAVIESLQEVLETMKHVAEMIVGVEQYHRTVWKEKSSTSRSISIGTMSINPSSLPFQTLFVVIMISVAALLFLSGKPRERGKMGRQTFPTYSSLLSIVRHRHSDSARSPQRPKRNPTGGFGTSGSSSNAHHHPLADFLLQQEENIP